MYNWYNWFLPGNEKKLIINAKFIKSVPKNYLIIFFGPWVVNKKVILYS
jgi:hypothetical protein